MYQEQIEEELLKKKKSESKNKKTKKIKSPYVKKIYMHIKKIIIIKIN